jgi:cell division protein FtsB
LFCRAWIYTILKKSAAGKKIPAPTGTKESAALKLLVKIIWLVLMTALVAVFGYHSYHKFIELQSLRQRQMAYEARIQELESRVATLAREIEEIHSDPDRLELLAREKLGLAGRNEKIFIIETDPTPAPE